MMLRRSFAGLLVLSLAPAAALAEGKAIAGPAGQPAESAPAQPVLERETSAEYKQGVHYQLLPVPVDTEDPSRIEVTEVFSYACIHCYRLDPMLEAWRAELPGDVAFRRVPAVFNESWALLARMFYAAETLGVGEKMHMPLFEAIHKRGLPLQRPEVAEELFWSVAGVKPNDFKDALNSFGVFTRLRQADAQGRVYRVTGVPTLIVNGKYRIDSGDAGGYADMLRIADLLIARERARRKAAG